MNIHALLAHMGQIAAKSAIVEIVANVITSLVHVRACRALPDRIVMKNVPMGIMDKIVYSRVVV